MKTIFWMGLMVLLAGAEITPALPPTLSYDGQTLSLSAENQTFGQVIGLFQRQLGLEIDIPGELNSLRLPLVEIRNLSMREALLKVLEGSNYDYILVAMPGQPDRVRKLVVLGRSAKIATASNAFRSMNRPVEDPFGGGMEAQFEDNANVQPEPVPAAPAQNPPAQGFVPGQPGVQPVPANPNQPAPIGVTPQQAQPQGLQPFNPFGNQNNRRSPY
jgi:hypothetical protein